MLGPGRREGPAFVRDTQGGELQAGPHVRLVSVIGDEDMPAPEGMPRSTSRSRGSIRSRFLRHDRSSRLRIRDAQITRPSDLVVPGVGSFRSDLH